MPGAGRLKVHATVSPSHAHLLEGHLAPTLEATAGDEAALVVHEVPQLCASGRYQSDGWRLQAREKLARAAAAVDEAEEGEPIAFCDADVAFLAPWVEPALEALDGRELAHLAEPGFSPAFWVARATPRLRAMLADLLARWGEWPGDGTALAAGIEEHGLDAVALDERFANPGNLGHPIPLAFGRATFAPPPGTLLFHANFCTLEDKDVLLDEVRRLAAGEERVPNRELVAAGPEGRGFFPERCPDRPFDRQSMFAREKARDVLGFVGDRPMKLIVEVGSWLGASTRWFAETFSGPIFKGQEHEHAAIVCIDTWAGLDEWESGDLVSRRPIAWEQFVVNCWHLRQWITPIRMPSADGLPAIEERLKRQGRVPDLVFIDGDHRYEPCLNDVMTSATAWPEALVLGDDYEIGSRSGRRKPVRDAVHEAAERLGRDVLVGASGIWALGSPVGPVEPALARDPVTQAGG